MSLMESQSVQIVAEGPVSELVINRPEALNALNLDVLSGLLLAFERLTANREVRALIIMGTGEKAFVAGADIGTMSQLGPRAIADYLQLGQRVMRVVECARFPVIAAVNGYALGGGMELALAADIILASHSAKFGQPEVNLGIIPGFGGTQRLIQRCGLGAARRLILTGDIIAAPEALQIGLADRVSAEGQLIPDAQAMGAMIASRGPLAVSCAKAVLRRSQETTLLSGLAHEVEAFLDLFATADREEGMKAFLQKRAPQFTGR